MEEIKIICLNQVESAHSVPKYTASDESMFQLFHTEH